MTTATIEDPTELIVVNVEALKRQIDALTAENNALNELLTAVDKKLERTAGIRRREKERLAAMLDKSMEAERKLRDAAIQRDFDAEKAALRAADANQEQLEAVDRRCCEALHNSMIRMTVDYATQWAEYEQAFGSD